MRARLLLALLATIVIAVPAKSHAPDSGSAPLLGTRVQLQHRSPQDLIALFSRATLPEPGRTPRSARAGTQESLLPTGVDGLLRGESGEVVLVGAQESCRTFADLLRRLDQAAFPADYGLETRFQCGASAREVAREIRSLPGGGNVKVEASTLLLTGSREWLFRALRTAIRMETQPPAADPERKL